MAAYRVARSRITDPVEYKKYTDLVPEIIAKFGGKVLARGGRYRILEGPEKFGRFVVIEFPSMDQAVACHGSRSIRRRPLSGAAAPARWSWSSSRPATPPCAEGGRVGGAV